MFNGLNSQFKYEGDERETMSNLTLDTETKEPSVFSGVIKYYLTTAVGRGKPLICNGHSTKTLNPVSSSSREYSSSFVVETGWISKLLYRY
ncbi:hypothetical protein J6590_101535 [Homalodisca vitripennis]|nr:hypothetical protein J6590_101535 [Homalodisca vitripennis]